MLTARGSLVLIVDVQAGLARAVEAAALRIHRTRLLVTAARQLDVPIIVSEQYPEGLGHTDPRLLDTLEGATVLAKRSFSCWREPAMRAAIEAAGRRQIVVCGMETHVCVQQTALDLVAAGFSTHIAADAAGSRRSEDRTLGLERLRGHGCDIVTSESVVFEWLERAEGPAFKALIPHIKASGDIPD